MVVGSWVGPQDPDAFVWIRRFDDEADRERFAEAAHRTDEWRTNWLPRIREFIDLDANVITLLNPTAKSVVR